jgi:large subunit ribosomal protein L21
MAQETPTGSYAIFKAGGKQYQAIAGKTLALEKINAQPGQQVVFDQVLVRKVVNPAGAEVIEIGQPYLATPVRASVIKHDRGDKIIVFRFKRRKKYKRKAGHRQPFTVVRIEAI